MSPIQSSTIAHLPPYSRAPATSADWNAASPARGGLALPYLDHASLRALGSASKRDRSRLEQRLASKTAGKLAASIAGMGVSTPLYESFFDGVAKEIAALDDRITEPLWQQLEHRFICMAENDIDVCTEAQKGRLLEKLVRLSQRNFPPAAHGRVLAELTGIVNRSFDDADAICTALLNLFEHCRELPVPYRVVPLRNLLLSLPFGASEAFRPQIRQLINAMRNEIPLFSSEQQSVIEHDMRQANTIMEDFFSTFAGVTMLSGQERQAGMSMLVRQMLTLEHNYADPTIASTLRFFSSPPHLLSAEMLAELVPMVGLIPDRENRAARLRTIVHLSDAFAAEKRVPLIKNLAEVAASLSEPDRKRILIGLYRGVITMNPQDRQETVQHINALSATLPARQFAQILVMLPTALQRLVRETTQAA